MIHKKVFLEEGNENAFLEIYVAEPLEGFTRDAILIIPGGAYASVCAEREGEPIAMAFMPYGYNAFVLHYSVKLNSDKVFPAQLIEASMAIKHIKDHAEEYGINPDRVFACGFSAGGHLAGSLGTMWHFDEVYEKIDMPYGYNKPTGTMLIYPVVSAKYHIGSFGCLLGDENPPEDLLKQCSLENNVDEKSSPVFIVHTSNDGAVDVRNSLALADAYKRAGKTFEMHIYPDAPHGVALGNEITRCNNDKWVNKSIAQWVGMADEWAKRI